MQQFLEPIEIDKCCQANRRSAAQQPGSRCSRNPLTNLKINANCDTKPVLAAEIDFIDGSRLLILWKLLKTRDGPNIPAYGLARFRFNSLQHVANFPPAY